MLPSGARYPIEVRESPMLAVRIELPRMTARVKVVPEKSVSIDDSTSHVKKKKITQNTKMNQNDHKYRSGVMLMG